MEQKKMTSLDASKKITENTTVFIKNNALDKAQTIIDKNFMHNQKEDRILSGIISNIDNINQSFRLAGNKFIPEDEEAKAQILCEDFLKDTQPFSISDGIDAGAADERAIYVLYRALLRRDPDEDGLLGSLYKINQSGIQKGLETIADGMVESDEYKWIHQHNFSYFSVLTKSNGHK